MWKTELGFGCVETKFILQCWRLRGEKLIHHSYISAAFMSEKYFCLFIFPLHSIFVRYSMLSILEMRKENLQYCWLAIWGSRRHSDGDSINVCFLLVIMRVLSIVILITPKSDTQYCLAIGNIYFSIYKLGHPQRFKSDLSNWKVDLEKYLNPWSNCPPVYLG